MRVVSVKALEPFKVWLRFADDREGVVDLEDVSCSARGETPERALAEVLVAKELWLEVARERGLPVPPPTYRPAASRAAG